MSYSRKLYGKGLQTVKDVATGTKASQEPRGYSLTGHIIECLEMAIYLLEDTEFGHLLHRAMNLSMDYSHFKKLCYLSVFCHDLGKAGSEFQKMIEVAIKNAKSGIEIPRYPQKVRHEYLSLVVLTDSRLPIKEWLLNEVEGDEYSYWCVVSAAFGHHLKTDRGVHEEASDGKMDADTVVFYGDALTKLISRTHLPTSRLYKMGFLQPFPRIEADVEYRIGDIRFLQSDLDVKFRETPVSAAVKWVTILSDVLGSMTPSSTRGYATYADALKGWRYALQRDLDTILCRPNVDYEQMLANHFDNQPVVPHGFQVEMGSHTNNHTMLSVSCGGGKTAAALMWANPNKKLMFCLPTTGTATQIHIDYAGENTELLHHRKKSDTRLRRAELEGDHSAGVNPDAGTEEIVDSEKSVTELSNYMSNVIYCTVDQVVGLLAYSRSSVMLLLGMVQSQFVFDEFNGYEGSLGSFHREFLKWFPNLPHANMSATVPPSLEAETRKYSPNIHVIRGGADQSNVKRYRIHIVDHGIGSGDDSPEIADYPNILPLIRGRTLWVCNQVKVVQSIAKHLRKDAKLYHSRYRYRDRVDRHRDFIELYRGGCQNVLGLATQVAEISLDISAQVLISEICHPASIIQRLGRLNRERNPSTVCDAYFYRPLEGWPYQQSSSHPDYLRWEEWLRGLEGRDISQDDLEEAFRGFDATRKYDPLTLLPVLDTVRRAVRTDSYPTALCITPNDYREHKERLLLDRVLLQTLEIPVPGDKKKLEKYSIASDLKYHLVITWPYSTHLGLEKPST